MKNEKKIKQNKQEYRGAEKKAGSQTSQLNNKINRKSKRRKINKNNDTKREVKQKDSRKINKNNVKPRGNWGTKAKQSKQEYHDQKKKTDKPDQTNK